MDAHAFLEGLGERSREAYGRGRRLLDFSMFLELVREQPWAMARSPVQFAADAIASFGSRDVPGIGGPVRRHSLWDAPFARGRGAVYGQETVQRRIVRILRAAAEEGSLDRLIVLHGPNGSSKSTLVEALMYGLEQYSATDEGALYRFHWVFPRREADEGGLGFGPLGGGAAPADDGDESYALLPPEEIAARVPCELRDNPLLVLPRAERRAFLEAATEGAPPPHTLRPTLDGDLCAKCRAIFDGLLAGYQGDLARVLRHVQVERWYIAPRYRQGAVVVPPQQSVDAKVREVSTQHPASGLPPILQHVTLLEPSGDLVDANRGVLEFSDFLKRPIELSKYLLRTTEKGDVAIGPLLAHLGLLLFATTNEKYVDAFKQSPDWTSFKARMELVAVPYLLSTANEAAIYDDFARALLPNRHVAPHVLDALATFAVLTRLRPPDPAAHGEAVRELVGRLDPVAKLRLYETGEPPAGLDAGQRRELLQALPDLRDEHRDTPDYEGRHGASAREIRTVLAAAAADPDGGPCLSPRAVFRHLRDLLRETSVYLFLQIEPDAGYHDPHAFADHAERLCARRALEDLQDALELVPPGEYDRRFERYVAHAVAFTGERTVTNPVTGAAEPPDEEVMRGVERLMNVKESPRMFRENLVARIGAFGVEHPGEKPDFRRLFPEILRALREDYFHSIRQKVRDVEARLLTWDTDEFEHLEPAQQEEVRRAIGNLETRYGYCAACAREAIVSVQRLLEEEELVAAPAVIDGDGDTTDDLA